MPTTAAPHQHNSKLAANVPRRRCTTDEYDTCITWLRQNAPTVARYLLEDLPYVQAPNSVMEFVQAKGEAETLRKLRLVVQRCCIGTYGLGHPTSKQALREHGANLQVLLHNNPPSTAWQA